MTATDGSRGQFVTSMTRSGTHVMKPRGASSITDVLDPPQPHKVLLFIPHLQQGGAERQILELMRRLPDRFQPILCLYHRDDRAKHHYGDYLESTALVRSLEVEQMGPRGLRRLVELIRKERPTILHSYRDKANFWARLASLRAKVPIVLTSVRNRKQGWFMALTEYFLQRVSDKVLTNSVGVAEELSSWPSVHPQRLQVIHNFLDLEKFVAPTDAQRADARAYFGFAPHERIVLMPGRLAKQKHQLGLAAALGILRKRDALRDVRIVLAGRRRDRLYSRLVPHVMRWFGVDGYVTYLEPVKEMTRLYHAADCVVMPSLWEGCPNAVLEAHACGLPVVASHAANRDGIVLHEASGFEVPTARRHRLADALERMLALSVDERRAMGARGRTNVVEKFHPDRILGELVALYDDLLQQKGLA